MDIKKWGEIALVSVVVLALVFRVAAVKHIVTGE